jgi:hypothetical protein
MFSLFETDQCPVPRTQTVDVEIGFWIQEISKNPYQNNEFHLFFRKAYLIRRNQMKRKAG